MLKLKQLGIHEWEFVHPDGYADTLDELGRGCDFYEIGDFVKAEEIFKGIVSENPDHLDGLHHWALVREKSGDLNKAKELWEKAVLMGLKAFPESFEMGKDRLIWGFLDNRPFLRCYHGFGIVLLKTGGIKQANKIFTQMLKLNPNDNQGARASAVDSFFYLHEPEKVIKVCNLYPYDCLADTLYGRALASFQLGDKGVADKCLKHAIKLLPKLAKTIIQQNPKKPKFMYPYRITVGGEDEAYEYWQRNNIHWESTPGAKKWIKDILTKRKTSKGKETTLFQLKVTLKNIKPPIWRRFLVGEDITLYRLYIILIEIMGWGGGHLHSFTINGKYYGTPDPEYDSFHETINEKRVKLKDVIDRERQKFSFEYDFGDGWQHEILVGKILPYEKHINDPICVKGARACPPDDCGGPNGYMDFLEAIQNPKHREHKTLLEWAGGSFNPEEFDVKEVSEALKGISKRKPWFEDFV